MICSEEPLEEAQVDDVLDRIIWPEEEGQVTLDGSRVPDAEPDALLDEAVDPDQSPGLQPDAGRDAEPDLLDVAVDVALPYETEGEPWDCARGAPPVPAPGCRDCFTVWRCPEGFEPSGDFACVASVEACDGIQLPGECVAPAAFEPLDLAAQPVDAIRVVAGAGPAGDGTLDAPFGTLDEALAVAGQEALVVVGPGEHAFAPARLAEGVELRAGCPATTTLLGTLTLADGARVVGARIDGELLLEANARVALERLVGPRVALGGAELRVGERL